MAANTAVASDDPRLDQVKALLGHLESGGTVKTFARLSDQEVEAIYAVAFNHFTARKFDEAIQLLKFLCLYDHTNARWFLGLGTAQQQAGDYAAAVEAYGMATILDVEDPRPQAQAGYCLMAQDHLVEAQSALEGAVIACDLNPARYATVRRQAEALLEQLRERRASEKS